MAERIVVVGLGYVGLPLAAALAEHFPVTGLDIDTRRITELRDGHDRTGEIGRERLAASSLRLTADPAECRGADVYIVTVPTPVDAANRPDLTLVRAATRTVAGLLDPARRPVVVYESTVYPGVTEGICGPLLEDLSGLVRGRDFTLGYSPERINPGDREHTVDRITKVVAGETPAVTARLCAIYGAITTGGTFPAASIAVAEAAKVIENAQRDINIAFMNEIARIFARMDLSVWDVLAAARTKWNFLPFQPGLVGGHCIGVDPYYLSFRAEQLGHQPDVILAGRAVNDGMGAWVADQLAAGLPAGRVLVLGLTFKENVPDLRNSKVVDVIARLQALGHAVEVHDPRADAAEAAHEYGLAIRSGAVDDLTGAGLYDAVLLAVAHEEYRAAAAHLPALVRPGGTFGDLKDVVDPGTVPAGVRFWRL
jgi:UDP-N-acetyl-D-glucosamine/UDP-N-acetyl-D-galactosamine dehydrogenase